MKLTYVDELREGMILAEDILGKRDVVYATSGTIINDRIIEGIKKLDIEFVYVNLREERSEKNLIIEKELDKKLGEEYHNTIGNFKSIYSNVKVGKRIIVEELESSIGPLVNEVIKSNNILGRLRQIEVNDEYTYKHSIDVCLLSTMIGKWLGYNQKKLNNLAIAGLLHDIGKSKVPNSILNKPAKLSKEEFDIMKNHASIGYRIVKDTPGIPYDVQCGVQQHHERIDGNGYPAGLKGDQIHDFGKIISIADVYSAMTSERVYRAKTSHFKVVELIFDNSFGYLDPHIANVFLNKISEFYVGNIIKLNTGEVGEIVLVNRYNPTRPLIKIQNKFLDLSKDYKYEIIDIIA